jgi:hypothetical protein
VTLQILFVAMVMIKQLIKVMVKSMVKMLLSLLMANSLVEVILLRQLRQLLQILQPVLVSQVADLLRLLLILHLQPLLWFHLQDPVTVTLVVQELEGLALATAMAREVTEVTV